MTALSGAQTLSSRTGPGRSACSREVSMYVEAPWCRHAGLPLLPIASLGEYPKVHLRKKKILCG